MPESLNNADFEAAYELVADALDAVPEADESRFLTKLTLLLARQVGDLEALKAAIAAARQNL